MDHVLQKEWLNPDAIQSIRKLYGLENPEVLNECIKTLQEWVQKQDHFPKKDFSRKDLEWALVTGKGSIERAKLRLDKYCTGKLLHKMMFEKPDISRREDYYFRDYNLIMSTKLDDNYNRVAIFKLLKLPTKTTDILEMFKHAVFACEYLRAHDYFNGLVAVLEYLDVEVFEIMKYISVSHTRSFISVAVDCFGMRLKGIHIVTNSKMAHLLVSLVKSCLSEKLKERVLVHNSYEGLYDYIPKDILPVDYGGKDKSLAELHEKYFKLITSPDFVDYLKSTMEYTTDESKRTLIEFNNCYMGTPGSFKRFIVD